MTIGIGLLGSEPSSTGVVPNQIILIADTMGSFGDTDSHPRLHKTFVLGDLDICAVAANQIDKASGLMAMVESHMRLLSPHTKVLGQITNSIQMACFLFKREQFISHVFPKYRLEPNVFAPDDKIPASLDPTIQKEWEEFDIGCDVIFGVFDHRGQASLLYVEGCSATVETATFPGYAAIGTGLDKAMFWLSYRRHNLTMSAKLSAFHAYEAKLMAESSAHVNEHIDLIIARHGAFWSQTSHDAGPPPPECPITLRELERMREEFGPKQVGTFMRSASQKAEPEQ